MVLTDETFEKPVHLKNETLRGLTTFAYTARAGEDNLLEGCKLDGQGARYALRIEPPHRPRVEFRSCIAWDAVKIGKVQFCYFNHCELYQAEDGIFSSATDVRHGYVLVEDCKVHKLGRTKQDHADCFQAEAGSWYVLRRNMLLAERNELVGVTPNSVAFFEAKYAPIRNVIIADNVELRGGGHMLQFYNDAHYIDGVRVTNNKNAGGWAFSPWTWERGRPPRNFIHYGNAWETAHTTEA